MRLKNQENEEFYKKQTITLVEIPKFLKGNYHSDNSMLAQWLRVIDGLNNERPVPVPEGSMFAHLHEKAKWSIFTEEFFVSEASQRHERHERPGGTDRRGAGAACRDGRKTALIKKTGVPFSTP